MQTEVVFAALAPSFTDRMRQSLLRLPKQTIGMRDDCLIRQNPTRTADDLLLEAFISPARLCGLCGSRLSTQGPW